MELKIINLKYKHYTKNIFNNLNFCINNQEILGVYCKNKFLQLYFLKLLLGNKKPNSGKIYLNNKNITTLLPKERKISYISSKALQLNFLPSKWILIFNVLKTSKFIHDSFLKYIKNKYYYKNLVFINKNLNRKKLIFKTNKIINEYFHNSIQIKKKWMKTYLMQINEFYKIEISKILKNNKNSIIIQNLHTFFYKKEKIRIYEGFLSFLQALWDNIYYISELDYLCDCYKIYQNKKIKNKNFKFIGAKLVCEKYLKILQTKIFYQRWKLIKIKKNFKKYRYNIFNTTIYCNNIQKKFIKNILYKKNSKNIITLLKLIENKWLDYNKKQEKLIFNLLPDEATIIKGKIVEYFHKYHLLLLNNKSIQQNKKNNYQYINLTNKKIITVIYNQALKQVKELTVNLNIKMNWFKITKNLSNFDYIKIKLINSILTNKELIILYNIFDNLTQNEAIELNEILLIFKKYNPQIIFLIFIKNIENNKNYFNKLLFFDKNNNFQLISKKQNFFYNVK